MPAITLERSLRARLGTSFEACAANVGGLVSPREDYDFGDGMSAFVQAAHLAFNKHYPLVLSPDDVWLCIAQGLAHHVQAHAETLRPLWVEHEGQLPLSVRRDAFVKGSPTNDWQGVFAEFSDLIALNCLAGSRELIVADFSTTGPIEKAASEVVLMSVLQKYFRHEVQSLCGTPSITLLGTPDDWKHLQERAERLRTFDCDDWIDALKIVLAHLADAAAGSPDTEFFQSFYKFHDMSGGPWFTGWINALFPYLRTGTSTEMGVNPYALLWKRAARAVSRDSGPAPSNFPAGLCSAPFGWTILTSRYEMQFLAGFVGIAQGGADDDVPLGVRPAIGWVVRDAPKGP
jgi:hypothetical protein